MLGIVHFYRKDSNQSCVDFSKKVWIFPNNSADGSILEVRQPSSLVQ